jgi:hypothetical protein
VTLFFVITINVWTTFDRIELRPAGRKIQGLPLHVDQNPWIHPDFTTIQGVLALDDCPSDRGTTVLVPGSKHYFQQLMPLAQHNGKKHYVEVGDYWQERGHELVLQQIPLRTGDILVWDSRTLHGATENNDPSNDRWVALVASGKAHCGDRRLVTSRLTSLSNCDVWNDRPAYMHASKGPRFSAPQKLSELRTWEELSLLGELVYGVRPWAEVQH